MNIGEAVRAERQQLRLSQSELGSLIGVSRHAVAALEQSRGRISTLLAVEPILRLNIVGLSHGEGLVERVGATRARDRRSLRDVAASAGVCINTVREIEAGRGAVQSLAKIVTALVPGAQLRGGTTRIQRQGFITVGRRISDRHNPSDYFATPAPVTRLLLDHEPFDIEKPILEPAVGEARAIDRVLRERGHQTICFDLNGRGDERRDFLSLNERFHALITNPPFSLHLEFVAQAKRITDHKIALLLPLNYLTGAQRHAEIWEDREFPLARVHVLNRGVNFMKGDVHGDKFHPAQLYLGWFVFERGHVGPPHINWIDCTPWIERKRQPKRSENSTASVVSASSNEAEGTALTMARR